MMAGAVERGIQKARRRMPETREEKMARFILKNARVFLVFTRGGIYTRKAKRRTFRYNHQRQRANDQLSSRH